MAQLQSLSIQGKNLTDSLTKVKRTTFTVLGANQAIIDRTGNVCTMYIDGKMNRIPDADSWSNISLGTIPLGYRPTTPIRGTFFCDGLDDWAKNFQVGTLSGYNDLYLFTRAKSYIVSSLGDGHGYWIFLTYITNDDFPS